MIQATTRRLSDLAGELRRRHVYRAAAVYAAAAFVVLQVAEIALPALNLPPWALTLAVVAAFLGFPVAIAFGWLVERSTTSSPAAPAAAARAGAAETDGGLAVLPFTVSGGGDFAYLGEGMVDLLSSKLRSRQLRSIDPHALLNSEVRSAAATRDPARCGALARGVGANLFVIGTILEAGGRLHLDATLYRTEPSLAALAEATAEGPSGELFSLVDELAAQLLTALSDGPGGRFTQLAAMTTESFPALKEYLQGESEMRAMRRRPAAEAFQRAVRHDPTFALAWYRLAVSALWSSQLELSRDASERAVALSERLSDHDRMLVEAFSAFLEGRAEDAERLYRAIVGNHPDDLEAWYQLGEVLFHYTPRRGGSLSESRSAWERVLELESEHVSALVHMAVIAAREGDAAEVDVLVKRALAISPDGDAVTWMLALRAWEAGDDAARERVAAKLRRSSDFALARSAWYVALPTLRFEGAMALSRIMTEPSRSPDVQAIGYLWLAHLELTRGRWRAAQAHLERLSVAHPASAIIYRALLSLVPFLDTPDAEQEANRASLEGWDAAQVPACLSSGTYFTVHNGVHPQLRTYLLGLLAARFGDPQAVLRHAAALDEWSGRPEAVHLARDQACSLRAELARQEGRDNEALRTLESACLGGFFELGIASPFFSQARERFLRAQLLAASGRDDEAVRWYASFSGHSIYDLVYLAPSHRDRAEIEERRGNLERAAKHYRCFIELWSDADPELLPRVQEARERLGRLARRSP